MQVDKHEEMMAWTLAAVRALESVPIVATSAPDFRQMLEAKVLRTNLAGKYQLLKAGDGAAQNAI